jgi:hypothetical protein
MLHAWDWAFADRWIPELSFGFSTLTAYPDADPETNTVDGYVEHYGAGNFSWATLRAAAGANARGGWDYDIVHVIVSGSSNTLWNLMGRSIFLFDTSTLTSGASISAAVMSIYGYSKQDQNVITPSTMLYTSAPATDTAVVSGDFDSLGAVAQSDTAITYAGWSVTAYNDITLNSTGIGNISKTGITKYGCRSGNYDGPNSEPSYTWVAIDSWSEVSGYYADQDGTANDPKLVVTYSTYTEDVPYVIAYVTRTDLFAGSSRT